MPTSTSNITDGDRARLRSILDDYTSNQKIGGVVYGAVRSDGEPIFHHASGLVGIAHKDQKMSLDTVFWVASFTKLATSVSCMQQVEQGFLALDDADQIDKIAPELRDVQVLQRDETGTKWKLVAKKRRITLRMLLNHTAGFGYAFEDFRLADYGRPVGYNDFCGDREEVLQRPLVNQPGEVFQYGTSMDWVGIILERVTKLSLGEYFEKNIFGPLGMRVSFCPSAEAKQKMAYMHQRLPDGTLKERDHVYRKPLTTQPGKEKDVFCAAGHGCFGPPTDFLRIISMLLNDGTDAKTGKQFLRPETVREMFTDQIPHCPIDSNEAVPVAKPWLANATPLSPMPEGHTTGWGLSFCLSHAKEASGRAVGSASWEGLPNLFWFADRTNNVGGIIATQTIPYGDAHVLECSERVETEIYKLLA